MKAWGGVFGVCYFMVGIGTYIIINTMVIAHHPHYKTKNIISFIRLVTMVTTIIKISIHSSLMNYFPNHLKHLLTSKGFPQLIYNLSTLWLL
jgi:hypothetical protein